MPRFGACQPHGRRIEVDGCCSQQFGAEKRSSFARQLSHGLPNLSFTCCSEVQNDDAPVAAGSDMM